MIDWALKDPSRFLYEQTELQRLAKEVEWLSTWAFHLRNGSLEVDFELAIHGKSYSGTLTYPSLFPVIPAYIRPQDKERWSRHQYGSGGALCLEWRADNWNPQVTGADLVRSAFKLLTAEQDPVKPSAVQSAHHLSVGQSMRGSEHRFVCTSGFLAAVEQTPMAGSSLLRTNTLLHPSSAIAVVTGVADATGSMQDIQDLPSGIRSALTPVFPWQGDGIILRHDTFGERHAIASLQDLLDKTARAGFLTQSVLGRSQETDSHRPWFVLLLGNDSGSLRVFEVSSNNPPSVEEYKLIFPETNGQRLPSEHKQFADLNIGIVGMGSVGSKVAVSLARSGFRKFILVDDDFLHPGNLSRHELSWIAVGVDKVEGVREALHLIAPDIDARAYSYRVAGQESGTFVEKVANRLSTCDLLIDATANAEAFLQIAAIAQTHLRPMCWAEVFAAGCGGLIARARPNLDPNPLAVRDAISRELERRPPAPYRDASGYDVDSQQPLVAYDSDVSLVASVLTRLAIDTVGAQGDTSEFPHCAYLVGLRKEWIFTQPLDTLPIAVTGEDWKRPIDIANLKEDLTLTLKTLLDISQEKA